VGAVPPHAYDDLTKTVVWQLARSPGGVARVWHG